jgi:hemoglobin/transferrin/lactoferrin receptor protein
MGLLGRNAAALLCGTAIVVFAQVSAKAQDAETTAEEQVTTEAQKQGRVTQLQRLVIGAGQEKVAIDTPQAVSVLEQADIDSAQPGSIADVMRKIPGVNATGSDRVLGQSFNIRGVGAPENAGDQGRIIVNVDGVQKFYEQYRLGSFFSDPELFKRVEVLRGPASSTLYGSGALGGVINFTTKDASDFIADGERGALKLKTSLQSNGKGVLGSATLAQRMGENAEFLLMGNYRQADVYQAGDGTDVIGSNFRAWSGLAKGTFKVGDAGTLRLSYQRWDSDLDDQQLSQTSTATFFGLIDRHVVDQTAIASYENPFSDNDMLDLKVALSYSDTSSKQRDADLRVGCSPGSFAVVCDSDYAYKTLQFNAQNTMEWRGASWENYLTYGTQIAHQLREATVFLNDGTLLDLQFHPEGTDMKAGFFVQNEFIWNEKLTLIPGIRFDWHELTPEDVAAGTDSFTDTAYSPKLAAHYKFNDTLAVFGSVAHTERFPTIDEVFTTSSGSAATFLPSLSLKKELSTNFEAGFALSGFDMLQPGDAGQLKFTGFYNDVTDLIRLRRDLIPGTFNNFEGFENVDSAEIYGFEVEAAYDSDYVFANAAYTYTIGKDTSAGVTPATEYLTTVAPHELKLTLGGKVPQQDVRFGWNARFVAGPQDPLRDTDVPPGTSTRYSTAFDVHDIFLSWTPQEGRARGWEVQAGIDNVFNRPYKEFLLNDVSKGRTFKLSLSKQIGW